MTDNDTRLPATLCVPAGVAADYPIAVLVHGSGSLDRDETVYSNKPFAELAHGLARQGIATLRYDKRTLVYSDRKVLSLSEETIDDAISAIALAQATTSGKVYVIGHSLGAMCAPWIASLSPQLGGIVMMAAPARPLEDIIVEQTDYLLPSGASDEFKADQIQAMKERMPQYFEGEIKDYDQVKTAQSLHLPILVLQGERDYQVRMTDFRLWQQALVGHQNAELRSYPGLNHLFHESNHPGALSSPSDYLESGEIPAAVIDHIAGFIKRTSK